MTGYKATNADMTCTPNGVKFQFELGKWYEVSEVELCKKGFHFCVHPSGPYNFYSNPGVRIFKVEAEQVLKVPIEAGADFKLVAKRIRLVEEITPGKKGNDKSNTGHRNTGHSNTGYSNTGNRNTGDSNTGNRNTGNRNTGYSNTGYSNATNYSAGFFCVEEPKVISFDMQTDLTREEYCNKYPVYQLGQLLLQKGKINFDDFKHIPGITAKKLEVLHAKHLEGRKL